MDCQRSGPDAGGAQLDERLVDERPRALCGVALAPGVPVEPIPELRLVIVPVLRAQMKPAEEAATRSLDRREGAVCRPALVLAQPRLQHSRVELGDSAGDEAGHLRVGIELGEPVEVGIGEAAEDEALGLEENSGSRAAYS